MATSTLKTRIKHKIGTATEWQTAATNSQFKPLEGELIIYEDSTNPKLKVGNGSSLVTALPFIAGNAITGVTRSGTTFTATHLDGTTSTFTQQDNNTNYYHTPSYTSTASGTITGGSSTNIKIATGTGANDLYVPVATGSAAGVTIVYPAASCTTFSSDSGTITPLAAQKAAKMFAITRPSSTIVDTIPRWSNTTGDVKTSGIMIEDVTNTKDTTKKAHVLSIPAEGGKKMVYGYCTDQTDGTSFIGGVFDASATAFPYNQGLAIGGTSGNLLWKGARVLTADDLYTHPTHTSKTSGLYKITVDSQGHVSAATAVAKSDITALGIPGSAAAVTLNGTSTTSASFYAPTSAGTSGYYLKSNGSGAPSWTAFSAATQSAAGLMSAADKKKLDGIATNANNYTYTLPNATSSTLGGVKVGSNITVSSGTISLTKANITAALGYTPPTKDTNTTYSAGTGISLSGTTFSNSGVRSIATGSSNGTISVNTNGKSANVAVKGLGSNAYTSTAYLPLAGGTMTGMITGFTQNNNWIKITKKGCIHMGTAASSSSAAAIISMKTYSGSWGLAGLNGSDNLYFVWGSDTNYNKGTNTTAQTHITSSAQIYGAVWNDYAEYRSQNETIEPGYITYCDDDGKLKKTVERLQKYEGVVSDTFGFAIGETDDCKTPLAVSGRALVYCDPEEEHFHSGDCVCAGPNGLAYRMTREEIIEFPDRIVGVVSEIPTYETWGTGNVEVNGRIWIKVK